MTNMMIKMMKKNHDKIKKTQFKNLLAFYVCTIVEAILIIF